MKEIIKTLNLDDTLNKNYSIQKKFNKVWLEIPHEEDYNEMADLLYLPQTTDGYKYLFVIVDLYTYAFDIQPIKTKSPEEILQAMKECFKRNYIKKPYASLSTDDGSEFKGVFHKWLYDENIYQKVGMPYRHSQQGTVESLNNQISKIIMLYLNKKSKEQKKQYNDWTDILPDIRKYLNEWRHKIFEATKKKYKDYNIINQNIKKKPKFHIGQIVHYKLDFPENWNMEKQPTAQFRNGDYRWSQTTKKIKQVVFMNTYPWYRYILDGLPRVSFSEFQLLPSNSNYATFKVKEIIDKKIDKKKVYYLIWWKGETKKQATWEPKEQLLEDGLAEDIDEFENLRKEEVNNQITKNKEKYVKEFENKEKINNTPKHNYNLRSRNKNI